MSSVEPLDDGRKFIAFRLVEAGDDYLVVVATIDPQDGGRFPWSTWYYTDSPHGSYQKAPSAYALLNSATAITMIDLIKAGRPLPPEFVAGLPLVY